MKTSATEGSGHERYFADRDEWRAWLVQHHKTEHEIWVGYFKKHSGKKSVQYKEAVEEALCFGWIDSQVKRIDDERYMQKYTPRKEQSNWSASNKERVARLTADGRMARSGIDAVGTAKGNGSWERLDAIETNPVIPEDLSKAFAKNKQAKLHFESFAASYRKQYLWWLSSAKRTETRQKRIIEIVKRCERGIKPGI